MTQHFLAAFALMLPAAAATAQTAPVRTAPPSAAAAPAPIARAAVKQELDAAFARIDANRDGTIVQSEAVAAQQRAAQEAAAASQRLAERQFAQLDADKNGYLSVAEFKAGAARPRMAPGQTVLTMLDGNKDNRVTAAEFAARRFAEFDRLDANRDGVISVQEQQAMRRR